MILLGHDLWQQKYNGSPDIVGKAIRASGVQRTVIGVMPQKFMFPFREALWVPLAMDPLATPRGQGPGYLLVAALKKDVSLAQAQVRTGAQLLGT